MADSNNIEVEWTSCPDCGYPIIERDGLRVDVFICGAYGKSQIDTDVEHECPER